MFDWQSLLKYVLEGAAVGVAAYLLPSKKLIYTDIIIIALTAAAVFAVLDQFSPYVAVGARQGTGFAIGYQQVGFGNDKKSEDNEDDGEREPPENICQMTDDKCTYSPGVSQEHMDKFLCKKKEDKCVPFKACKRSKQCEWAEDAEQLADATGRSCTMVDEHCRMKVNNTVEGFEGFPKNV